MQLNYDTAKKERINSAFSKFIQEFKEGNINLQNYGLVNGTMGISIFCYHFARCTMDPNIEKYADELFESVISGLTTSMTTDFDNGLAGIGWGIEYLVQNQFAEGNTDEILEEVDNKIFKALNEENHTSFELMNGMTGYLFYLTIRLKNRSISPSMAQRINRELLIFTINKLDEMVTNQFQLIVRDMYFDLFWKFPLIIYGLLEVFKLDIYNDKIICIFRQWLPNLEVFIPSMHINRLFLAVTLKKLYSLFPEKHIEKQIQILLFAIDFDVLKSEVDYNVLNIRFGWPGFVWLLKQSIDDFTKESPNYHLIVQTYNDIICKHLSQIENFSMNNQHNGLSEFSHIVDFAGIGLMELLWPGVLSSDYSLSKTL